MQYTYKDPSSSNVVTIDAQSDDEAVEKILTEVKSHAASNPGTPLTDDEQLKTTIRSQMSKGEADEAAQAQGTQPVTPVSEVPAAPAPEPSGTEGAPAAASTGSAPVEGGMMSPASAAEPNTAAETAPSTSSAPAENSAIPSTPAPENTMAPDNSGNQGGNEPQGQ